MKNFFTFLLVLFAFTVKAQTDIPGAKLHPLVPRSQNFYISKFMVDSNSFLSVVNPNNIPQGYIFETDIKSNLTRVFGIKTTIVFKLKRGKKFEEEWSPNAENEKYMIDEHIGCRDVRGVNIQYKLYGYHVKGTLKIDEPVLWEEITYNKAAEMYVITTLEVKGAVKPPEKM